MRAAARETRRRTAGRRVLRSGRKAVRESRGGDQPVDRAVRRDQRARRVPVRLQRDAAHGAPAAPADRRPAPRRLHARGRDRGAAARRGRARADRDGARARCSATSSRSTSSTPTPATSPRRSRSPPSASSAAQSIAIAAGGGMLAACVAVLSPLRDILSRDPLAATAPKEDSGGGSQSTWLLLAGLAAPRAERRHPAARPRGGDRRDGQPDRRAAAAVADPAQRDARARQARSPRRSRASCRTSP